MCYYKIKDNLKEYIEKLNNFNALHDKCGIDNKLPMYIEELIDDIDKCNVVKKATLIKLCMSKENLQILKEISKDENIEKETREIALSVINSQKKKVVKK